MSFKRPRILISEPNSASQLTLPYLWAVLKSYWEHYGSEPDAVEWLDPIYARHLFRDELTRVSRERPDVVGLSCYTWNWALQLEVGLAARKVNPNCLIVAGGPHPDYKDPDFFLRYPFIDCVVVKDGEIPFTQILEGVLADNLDLGGVAGLYLPNPAAGRFSFLGEVSRHRFTGAAIQPDSFEYSPYLEQSSYYERVLAQLAGQRISVTWETNRGCPYGCSFCDWGSATLSKVRRFSLRRVEAEAEWVGKMKINFLMLADANFGIFPRDVEIAVRLASVRAKYGYPRNFYYSPAKNNPDRTVEIARIVHDSGLTRHHVLAVQHTDPQVLSATARSNISAERYREVLRQIGKAGISAEAQLIIGIPGDTPAKWRGCLAELMDWGVHERFHVSPYALLPNAPAAHPDFVSSWGIQVIERELVPFEGCARKDGHLNSMEKLVVACKTYTKKEWAEMSVYTAFLLAYHNRSLVRLPVFYLHFVYGISYRELNDAIYDDFCRYAASTGPLFQRVEKLYTDLVSFSGTTDVMDLDEFCDAPIVVDPSRWIFAKTAFRLEEFYRELETFLVSRYPKAKHLKSAIDFQKNIVVDPAFDSGEGRSFPTDCDWPAFLSTAGRQTEFSAQPEPLWFETMRIATVADHRNEQSAFLHFGAYSENSRVRWVMQMVQGLHTSDFGVFSQVAVDSNEPDAPPPQPPNKPRTSLLASDLKQPNAHPAY